MCIETKKLLTTVKKKKVFKVLRPNKTTLYYRVDNSVSVRPQKFPFDRTLLSRDFSIGFGFHCFASKKTAEEYVSEVHCNWSSGVQQPIILKATIPVDTNYAKGKIWRGLIGEHLPALRTDKIIVHDKIVT